MNFWRTHPKLTGALAAAAVLVLIVLYLSLLGSGSGATHVAPLPH